MELTSPFYIVPVLLLFTFVLLVACVAYESFQNREPQSRYLTPTVTSVLILFVFYPMTIAPTGVLSNGGLLGLGSLIIASGLAWLAFARNRQSPWIRKLIQLPVTAGVTLAAIHDAYCQYLGGWWLGF